jgi:serine/threonine protein kinase
MLEIIFYSLSKIVCYNIDFSNYKEFTSLFKHDPLIGVSIHKRYKVKDVLGEGSFGKVYLVQDQNESNNLE